MLYIELINWVIELRVLILTNSYALRDVQCWRKLSAYSDQPSLHVGLCMYVLFYFIIYNIAVTLQMHIEFYTPNT